MFKKLLKRFQEFLNKLSPNDQKIWARHPQATVSVKKLTDAQLSLGVEGGTEFMESAKIVCAEIDYTNLYILAGGHTHKLHQDGRRPLTLLDAYEMGKKVNEKAMQLMVIEKENRIKNRKEKKKRVDELKKS